MCLLFKIIIIKFKFIWLSTLKGLYFWGTSDRVDFLIIMRLLKTSMSFQNLNLKIWILTFRFRILIFKFITLTHKLTILRSIRFLVSIKILTYFGIKYITLNLSFTIWTAKNMSLIMFWKLNDILSAIFVFKATEHGFYNVFSPTHGVVSVCVFLFMVPSEDCVVKKTFWNLYGDQSLLQSLFEGLEEWPPSIDFSSLYGPSNMEREWYALCFHNNRKIYIVE